MVTCINRGTTVPHHCLLLSSFVLSLLFVTAAAVSTFLQLTTCLVSMAASLVIGSKPDWQQSCCVFLAQAGPYFNHIHWSCVHARLPRMWGDMHHYNPAVSGEALSIMTAADSYLATALPSLDQRTLLTALWCWAKLEYQPDGALLQAVLLRLQQPEVYSNLHPAGISLWAYSLARLDIKDDAPWSVLKQLLRTHASRMEPQQVSNVLWALSKLQMRHDDDIIQVCDYTKHQNNQVVLLHVAQSAIQQSDSKSSWLIVQLTL